MEVNGEAWGHCKNCKSWLPQEAKCWGKCMLTENDLDNLPKSLKTKSWVWCAKSGYGVLITHETFGCNQFRGQ